VDSSIVNMVATQVNDFLVKTTHDNVAKNDPTLAELVRPGRLQEDPTDYGIIILTHENDLEDLTGWDHSIYSAPFTNLGLHAPSYEVGSGEIWYYRFTTEIIFFVPPTTTTREEAHLWADVILNRAIYSLRTTPVEIGPDTFGNMALAIYVVSARNIEQGGPDQFIWRSKIKWQCMVGSSY
jgi:hypothetical protein